MLVLLNVVVHSDSDIISIFREHESCNQKLYVLVSVRKELGKFNEVTEWVVIPSAAVNLRLKLQSSKKQF